ncbi:MAG: hypothetical protein KAJ95_00230 [Gammaproteobacteria bacterium]|nr:hypothetical protein [Gammaproteobacteria bacterium]
MLKTPWVKILTILSIAVVLNGCAVGNTLDYRSGTVDYDTGITKKVNFIVAFQDIRPYVLSGNKKNTFVGLQRSVAGIPYPVNTKSGQPLADDFAALVGNSLISNGLKAEYVSFQFRKDVDEFVKENSKEGMKILIFTMREWKTDVHFTASIHYDVTLSVYDSTGNKLAETQQQGSDPIGPNERQGRKNLPDANIDIIGSLLKTPKIQAAILSDETAVPAEKVATKPAKQQDKCSVKQILTMKESGLSDSQVQAACK